MSFYSSGLRFWYILCHWDKAFYGQFWICTDSCLSMWKVLYTHSFKLGALGINKTGLGDLQISMNWPRTRYSFSLFIHTIFIMLLLSYTSVSMLSLLPHSLFPYFIYCTPSVLVPANSLSVSSIIVLERCPIWPCSVWTNTYGPGLKFTLLRFLLLSSPILSKQLFNFCLISVFISRSSLPFAFFLSVTLSIVHTGLYFFFPSENCLLSPEFSVWHLKVICGSLLVNFVSGKFSLLVFWLKSLTSKYILLFLSNSYNCPLFFSLLFPSHLRCAPQQCSTGHGLTKADTQLLSLRQVLPCCPHRGEWQGLGVFCSPPIWKAGVRVFPSAPEEEIPEELGPGRNSDYCRGQRELRFGWHWGPATGEVGWGMQRSPGPKTGAADISGWKCWRCGMDEGTQRQEGLGLTIFQSWCHQLGFWLGDLGHTVS